MPNPAGVEGTVPAAAHCYESVKIRREEHDRSRTFSQDSPPVCQDRKRFRVRYDWIMTFDLYNDGVCIMRDVQTAWPQVFRTGDGWFAYKLATNLSQLQG